MKEVKKDRKKRKRTRPPIGERDLFLGKIKLGSEVPSKKDWMDYVGKPIDGLDVEYGGVLSIDGTPIAVLD